MNTGDSTTRSSRAGQADEVVARARELLASAPFAGAGIRSSGAIGDPLKVTRPDGTFDSWMVPLTRRDRLSGYLRLDRNLELIRSTTFQRAPDSLEGCPEAATWLSPDRVRATAESIAVPGERLGAPRLTFDQTPDRLAWEIEATSAEGKVRNIMVVGDTAYEQTESEDLIGGGG